MWKTATREKFQGYGLLKQNLLSCEWISQRDILFLFPELIMETWNITIKWGISEISWNECVPQKRFINLCLTLGIHKRGFKCCSCPYLMSSEVFPKFPVFIPPPPYPRLCIFVPAANCKKSFFCVITKKNYQMVLCIKRYSSD